MRKLMIAGNWKMNKTYTEGVVLAQGLADALKDTEVKVDVVVCPPTVDLKGVSEVIDQASAPFALGAQNVYFEESGAFTGEVSAPKNSISGGTFTDVDVISLAGYVDETVYACEKQADGSLVVTEKEYYADFKIPTGFERVLLYYDCTILEEDYPS